MPSTAATITTPGPFSVQYDSIKFGRIKQKDKLKFCPLESLSFASSGNQVSNHHLLPLYIPHYWTGNETNNTTPPPATTTVLRESKQQVHYSQQPLAGSKEQSLNNSNNINNAAPKPSSWSALLKSKEPSSSAQPASQSTSPSSTPASLKKKKNGDVTPFSNSSSSSVPNHQKPPQLEKWRQVDTTCSKRVIPRGLVNNGNMCFLNSVMQPLVHTPPFFSFFCALRQKSALVGYEDESKLLNSMVEFVSEFRTDAKPDPEKDYAFSCDYVYDAIRSTMPSIDALKGRQEDASEFLGYLLDGLHEELLKTIDRPRVQLEQGVEWTQVGKKNKTISTTSTDIHPSQIMRIFGGRWKSIVKSGGTKESNAFEAFIHVALDITSPSITSVEDALARMTEPETLEDFAHAGDIQSTRQALFDQLPPVLILSLKRFHYDGVKGTIKIGKHIAYPSILVIPPSFQTKLPGMVEPVPKSYQLYAVVHHHGKFAQGGHYTCDINNNLQHNENTTTENGWTRFDDSSLEQVDSALVTGMQKDRQPYILFYIEKSSE